MTLHIDRQRQAGDMAGFNLKKDIKGRGVSSVTHGANPQLIDSLQDFHFKLG
jgi:hypothetical protein